MKRSGFIVLSIAFFISLVFHFALIRLVRYEKKGEVRETKRYEVNLVYYEKPAEEIKETRLKRTAKKKKHKEQEKEKAEPEQLPVQKEVTPEQPPVLVDADISEQPHEKIQHEEPADRESGGAESKNQPLQESKSDERVSQEQPDYTLVLSGLRDDLLKRKVYPYAARKKGFEGIVVVFVRLDADGNPLDIRLARSSGHRVLDNAAVSLVKKVLPYRHNTGNEISFEIPIKYSLVE